MINWLQSKVSTLQNYQMNKYLQNIRQSNGSTDYEFNTCNKIFLAEDIPPRECISRLLKDEIQTVDFHKNPEQAREKINLWVEEVTKRNIRELLSSDAVHENTNLILVIFPLYFF